MAYVEQGAIILSDSGKIIRYVRKCESCGTRFEPEKTASTYPPPPKGYIGGDDFFCSQCGRRQRVVIRV